jgi:hypothetical protein
MGASSGSVMLSPKPESAGIVHASCTRGGLAFAGCGSFAGFLLGEKLDQRRAGDGHRLHERAQLGDLLEGHDRQRVFIRAVVDGDQRPAVRGEGAFHSGPTRTGRRCRR